MRFYHVSSIVFCALVLAVASVPAFAAIVISPVRIIYDAAKGEATVRLINESQAPDLVQSWLDTGSSQDARNVEVPFIVSPPLVRVDPGKTQTLRIVYSGEPLPQDRESVFWLNVLAAPPQGDASAGASVMQLSVRTRLKMIYRPAGLSGTAAEAPSRLTWQLAAGARPVLQVSNPTPHHISFSAVELVSGGQVQAVQDPGPIAPFETRELPLPQAAIKSAGARVRYQVFNDYGGVNEGEAALQAPAR
uniref:fimbrial biogenesis chaperone n=1 Tax=Castellaniella defragrans TaxID=75697 RepID=UPI00333EBE2B